MVDVESIFKALKASWVPKLLNSKYTASILNVYLQRMKISFKMLLDGGLVDKKELPTDFYLPDFYCDCMFSFNSCKTSMNNKNLNVHRFLTQPIWCNSLFKHKGKSLLLKNWTGSNPCIYWVKDKTYSK